MPPNNNRPGVWARIMGSAVFNLRLEICEKVDGVLVSGETLEIHKEYIGDANVHTLHICMCKRVGLLWLKKIEAHRPLLRITDIAEPDPRSEDRYEFRRYRGAKALKCELFLGSPDLKGVVSGILEPLATRLGYPRVEYIDMSKDYSAWYPGERPVLPKAIIWSE